MEQFYSSRKNAIKGARRRNLAPDAYTINELPDGRWEVCENAAPDTSDIADDLNLDVVEEIPADDADAELLDTLVHGAKVPAEDPIDEPSPEDIGDETVGEDDGGPSEDDAPPAEIATSDVTLVDETEPTVEVEAPTEIASTDVEIVDEHHARDEDVKLHSDQALTYIEDGELDKALNELRTAIAIRDGAPRPGTRDGGRSYKEMQQASGKRSTIANPVKVVFQFLDANQGLGRKQALDALVEMGVNWSTAHTQYQKWRRSRADRKI